MTRQQVYDWRRAARRGDLGMRGGVVGFVEVVPAPTFEEPAADDDAPEPIGIGPDSASVAAEGALPRTPPVRAAAKRP